MTNYVMLNNVEHHNLKVSTKFCEAFGDNVASAHTFVTEFSHVQKEYPILFRKDANTDKFEAIALLGIQKDENVFLDETKPNGWDAAYIPAVAARGPFIIGFKEDNVDGQEQKTPMVFVDKDSPRLSDSEGNSVFLEMGGNSPYLDHVSKILQIIHAGVSANEAMFTLFEELEIIDPVTIDIQLKNDDKHQIAGFYTVSEEKLAAMAGDKLEKLNKSGFLSAAFMVISSLSNVQRLIGLKNRTL